MRLEFDVTRAGGLDTTNFVANAAGAYFSADLTDGTNTGAQAWKAPSDTPVPEPMSLALFGVALSGLGLGLRITERRRAVAAH